MFATGLYSVRLYRFMNLRSYLAKGSNDYYALSCKQQSSFEKNHFMQA